MTKEQLDAIRARVDAALTYEQSKYVPEEGAYVSPATKGEDTVEWMTCPLCDGDGEVEGQRYDAKETVAATVVAYGVGEGLRRAEEWVENAPADMRALLAEVERLTADPLPAAAWVREVERAAFQRGAEAMREALIDRVRDSMMQGFFVPHDVKRAVEGLRNVPVPEDAP